MHEIKFPPVQQKPLLGLGCTIPFAELVRYGPVLRKLGLQPEILLSSLDVLQADEKTLAEGQKFCAQFAGATCHAPFISLFWGDVDEAMKNQTEEVLLRTAEVAAQLGVHSAVIHPNWDPRQMKSHDEWLSRSMGSMGRVAQRFVDLGVQPLIENVREYEPQQILRILEDLPEETGVCIDPGHAGVISEMPVAHWFDVIGDRLAEIHMHNNDGTSDQHRALSEGTVWDANAVLHSLIEKGRRFHPVIEPKDQETAVKSLQNLSCWGFIG